MKDLIKYSVPGFKAGAAEAAIKKPGRLDMALIFSELPATAAGVFTRNRVKAAPVLLDMLVAKKGRARAIVANSGNANACNGDTGMRDALVMAELTAEVLGLDTSEVFVASTGVIGANLPMERVGKGIAKLPASLGEYGWEDAARAIMTTDTFPKICGVTEKVGGRDVTVLGIAKGSGMIAPNMATMLGFVATDASVDKAALKAALKDCVEQSFNRITVDGDTSTNDCVLALANGAAGNEKLKKDSADYLKFKAALNTVLGSLARMVAKDGEGATKLVEVKVTGAKDEREALMAAKTVANSPLVKTAMFAADPNWGRVAAAVGRSGAELDADTLSISFDGVAVMKKGMGVGAEAEKKAVEVMKQAEYTLTVGLGAGKATATVLTTDFSYDYVKINAEYRT